MPKNTDLPGMEAPKIKDIELAAEKYVKARDKRIILTEQECAAKTELINVVKANLDKLSVDGEGNAIYKYDDQVVLLVEKTNVKVKSAVEPDDDSE